MSESEDFLKRWSRRKREAAAERAAPAKADDSAKSLSRNTADPSDQASMPHADERASGAATGPAVANTGDAALPFDLSKLPSLDSIGPATDIRIFMQPGVPASLTRAALRRAWTADPAIRDYIGLSENAWDFTAPDSMAGFGALDPAEVPKLIANFLGAGAPQSDSAALPAGAHPESATETSSDDVASDTQPVSTAEIEAPRPDDDAAASTMLQRNEDERVLIASHNEPVPDEPQHAPRPRLHGRALPQ